MCAVLLPGDAQGMPAPDAIGTVDEIARYLARLHPLIRMGFSGLIDALNILPLSRGYGSSFVRLSDERARAFLHDVERSRVYALRGAFVAMKALVMLHYYGNVKVEAKLGYSDECLA